MIIHDPKKSAALIISGIMPSGEDKQPQEDNAKDLAGDILHAIRSGSAEDLAFALRAFHEHCEGYEGDDEPDEGAE